MAYTDFDKLKNFFLALNKSGFHPERMDPKIITPQDKIYCLNLIRQKNPELKEKSDKELFEILRDPNKVKLYILGKFVAEEGFELVKILDEKPVTTEATAAQPTGEAPSDQGAVQPAGGSMPGGLPSMPTATAPRFQRPQRFIVQKETEPPVGPATAKIDRLATLEAEKAQAQVSPTPAPQRVNFSSFKSSLSSGFQKVQNFASKANPFLKTNLGRIANGLKGMAGGIGRDITGPGLTGAANVLGKAGKGGLNAFENLSKPGGLGGGGIGKLSKSSNKVAFGLIGGLLLLVLISGLIGGLTGNTQPGGASPISGGGNYSGANIASCKFTRGAESPKEVSYKSSLLLSYIQEASQKSGIPPAVFAAFIRVESPASSYMTDDQILNYSANCAESPTGALGIMQIQPPGTTSARGDAASCDSCIDAGAKLVGKTVATMTRQDYCDPRTNIIVGAGWILKRMGALNYGDGTTWKPEWTNDQEAIKALVNTYYGCLDYGAGECAGPYNYANDVLTSIQNCQAPAVAGGGSGQGVAPALATDCPILNGTITCGSLATPIQTAGGLCGHCSVGYEKYMFNCTPEKISWGIKYALDISASPSQPVLLPKINGHIIKWNHISDKPGGSGYIQTYSGTDTETQQNYLIQFQHTEAYSGNRGEHLSGERGANACSTCEENHIHVQLGDPASLDWLDAAQYFCRK